jgi:hypothetical protein
MKEDRAEFFYKNYYNLRLKEEYNRLYIPEQSQQEVPGSFQLWNNE